MAKKKPNDLGIIVSVWHEPSIDWLLANQGKVTHYFHDLAVKGEL